MKAVISICLVIVLLIAAAVGIYFAVTMSTSSTTSPTVAPSSTNVPATTPLASVISPTPAQDPSKPWVTLTGFDFSGNDMVGSPYNDMTQEQCAEKCKATQGCVAGMYSPNLKYCWLKNSLQAGAIRNADRILVLPSVPSTSAVNTWAVKKNTDHTGDDIACYQDGSSQDKCAALCAIRSDCKAYNRVDSSLGGEWSKGGCCAKYNNIPMSLSTGIDIYS